MLLSGCTNDENLYGGTYYKEEENILLDSIYDVIDAFDEYDKLYGIKDDNDANIEQLTSESEKGKDELYKECENPYTTTVFEQGFSIELTQIELEKNIIIINNNVPYYNKEEFDAIGYEYYGNLDSLGRCTSCFCSVGLETFPTTERGEIYGIEPTGYNMQTNYTSIKEWEPESEGYLYNRCHLIGWQLTGEDANEKNLITGTRYFNAYLMLEYENKIASYVRTTGNHVLYRVTPIFLESNLVAEGVLMEAQSIEDNDVQFCVYVRNVQPGITIDYETGINWENDETEKKYILNIRSKKIHLPECESVESIGDDNRKEYYGVKSQLLQTGYTACNMCEP